LSFDTLERESASSLAPVVLVEQMAQIDWPAIDADRAVEAAALLELLSAFAAMRAQRLQFAEPELRRIVVVRLDVISNARCYDSAFTQAPFA
jgi:hypothetical protein